MLCKINLLRLALVFSVFWIAFQPGDSFAENGMQNPPVIAGVLHTDGMEILDAQGGEVVFRGVDVSGMEWGAGVQWGATCNDPQWGHKFGLRQTSYAQNTSTMSEARLHPSPSYRTGPHGLFVHAPNLPVNDSIASDIQQYIITSPTVTGVNIVVPWSSVDRGPGAVPQYDWTFVENAVKPWTDAGKTVGFLVWGVAESSGQQFNGQSMTPQYVLDQVNSVFVASQPSIPRTPVYWEPGYSHNYRNFVKAFILEYGNKPWVSYIRFGIGYGAEDYVQNNYNVSPFADQWNLYGLSEVKWIEYSLDFIEYLATLHSPCQLMVTINNFQFDNQTGINNLAIDVAQEAVKRGIGFGTQGLSKYDLDQEHQMWDRIKGPKGTADWLCLFSQYYNQVPLEAQTMAWSQLNGGGRIGCLQAMVGLALRNHANILELYPSEWLVAYDPSYSGYGEYNAVYSKTLESAAAALSQSVLRY